MCIDKPPRQIITICISPMQSVNTNLEAEDELIWGGGGIVEGR